MKTFWTIVLGLFLLVGCTSTSDPLGNWVKRNDFEGLARGAAVSFVIGDKAYVGLGYNSDDNAPNNGYLLDFWVYNSSTGLWTTIAPFPGHGRTNAVGFAVNGKGYVGTGFDDDNKLSDFWEYDPTADEWIRKDDFLGGARHYAVAFALSVGDKNYGYVGTGYGQDASDKNDFYRFDPTAETGKQWEKISSIGGSKRSGATAFTYKGNAYVCTGKNNGTSLTDMWMFNPNDNTWTQKIDLDDDSDWTIIRSNASSLVLDDKAYVFFGQNSSNTSTVWRYDFANDTWDEMSSLEPNLSPRYSAIAFTVGGTAYAGTGLTGGTYLDDMWEWRPYEEEDDDD